jgi:hypothetical protein
MTLKQYALMRQRWCWCGFDPHQPLVEPSNKPML